MTHVLERNWHSWTVRICRMVWFGCTTKPNSTQPFFLSIAFQMHKLTARHRLPNQWMNIWNLYGHCPCMYFKWAALQFTTRPKTLSIETDKATHTYTDNCSQLCVICCCCCFCFICVAHKLYVALNSIWHENHVDSIFIQNFVVVVVFFFIENVFSFVCTFHAILSAV